MEKELALHFTVETKTLPACSPRLSVDSVIDVTTDKLMIVYDKYVPKQNNPSDGLKVNIVFLHGLGMNRSVWEYYIVKLWKAAKASNGKWRMGTLLLIDQINHGDSAVLNKEKLGANYDWADGSRDFCKVSSKELSIRKGETNILIGHSMGGCQAIICSLLSPVLFSLVIAMEPVIITRTLPTIERVSVLKSSFYNALRSRSRDTFIDEKQYDEFQKKVGFYGNAHPEIFERFKQFEKVTNHDGTVRTKANIDQVMITYLAGRPTGDWVVSSLKFLKTPLVAMFGTKSTWCPPENKQLIEREVSNVITEDIDGGYHLMNLEMPDTIITRITYHIERHVQELPPLDYLKEGEDRQTRFRKLHDDFTSKRLGRGKHLYPYTDPRANPRTHKL